MNALAVISLICMHGAQVPVEARRNKSKRKKKQEEQFEDEQFEDGQCEAREEVEDCANSA